MDTKLPAVRAGEACPADAAEAAGLADVAQHPARRFYAASADLWVWAFKARAALADDLDAGHRYNAACAAALAGYGQGEDADRIDDAGRSGWRQQALQWLQADLAARSRQLATKEDKQVSEARQALEHWRRDPALAGVRDRDALAKLPEGERASWARFWGEVEAVLAAKPPAPQPR